MDSPIDAALNGAIGLGVDFLTKRQRSDGSFCIYYSTDHTFRRDCVDELTSFAAVTIAICLRQVGSAASAAIIARTASFLVAEMHPSGIWRYFARAHPYYRNIPADVDTTALASWLLRALGIEFADNRDVLLLNRDTGARFYTWLKPRLRITTNRTYWRVVGPRLLQPIRSHFFWRVFNTRPNDVDALINANVAWYLGDVDPAAAPARRWLRDAALQGEEETCDKWYRDRFVFYYLATRTLSGDLRSDERFRSRCIERASSWMRAGAHALDVALAMNALITCEAWGDGLDAAARHLLAAQREDGSWGAFAYYYDGPQKVGAFGSEELTTGFCVEALSRYARQRPPQVVSATEATSGS